MMDRTYLLNTIGWELQEMSHWSAGERNLPARPNHAILSNVPCYPLSYSTSGTNAQLLFNK